MNKIGSIDFPKIRNFGVIEIHHASERRYPSSNTAFMIFFILYHINYSACGAGHLSFCAKIDKKALHLMVVAKI